MLPTQSALHIRAMHKAFSTLLLICVIALSSFNISAQQRTKASQAKRALVISLDGLDGRYLSKPDKYNLRIPTLRRLMRDGVSSQTVIAVYPTVTYPNHTTMVTGAYPARHGIFGNDLFEPPDQKQTRSGLWFARDTRTRGMHGYLPTRPDYRTSFIASGASINRRGDFGEIQMTQVGATIARVLGIGLRDAQGEALRLK